MKRKRNKESTTNKSHTPDILNVSSTHSSDVSLKDTSLKNIPSKYTPLKDIKSKAPSLKNIPSKDISKKDAHIKVHSLNDKVSKDNFIKNASSNNISLKNIPLKDTLKDIKSIEPSLKNISSKDIPKKDALLKAPSLKNIPSKDTPPVPANNQSGNQKPKRYDGLPLLKSMIRLQVTGFNQTRILNGLNAAFIEIRDIRRTSPKILEFTIHKKDSAKTFAILEKMCYNYLVLAESGTRIMLSSILRHIGFAVGALVFCVLVALSTQVVWRIEVSGNELTDSQLIIRSLEDYGVKVGSFKSKVDKTAVTQRLRAMEGIAEGTVEVIGTTIVIKVIEQKSYNPPDDEPEYFSDIVSGYDAEITRIDVKKGTANYSVGDRVAKDTVLIRGERLNSIGEPLEKVKAEGSVYGMVSFSEKYIFSDTEQILTRTGKKKIFTNLSLFGLKIGKKNQPNWEKEITEGKLFFIPIKTTRTVCYETKIVEQKRDLGVYVEALKDEAVLKNVIKAGGSEIETVTTLTPIDGGLYMLNIYIQAEILIGQA